MADGKDRAVAGDNIATWIGVHDLLTDFARAVDGQRPAAIGALFTADGLFRPGQPEVTGAAAVESFYRERQSDPRRVTRHVWTNVQVGPARDGRANLQAMLTNYAFEPKLSETELQVRVGDVYGVCEFDGARWRFAEHVYHLGFATRLPLEGLPPVVDGGLHDD